MKRRSTRNLLYSCLLFGMLASPEDSKSQGLSSKLGPNDTIPVMAILVDGEWYPAATLDFVSVIGVMTKANRKKVAEWNRLRNAVYVTYPYARRAGLIINEINRELAKITDPAKRKAYLKSREEALRKEFAKPLSDLSVYQGRVLMKLINRQTGNNCYNLIKEYRGGVTARLWQTVAFFFNSNMKQPYEALNGDKDIEGFVMEIEAMYW